MDQETQKRIKSGPDYCKIYKDLIEKNCERIEDYKIVAEKEYLNFFEIQLLNKKLFGSKERELIFQEQRYRAYNEETILNILHYQKEHKLNNSQLARHFKLSRTTIAKWLKIFNEGS